MTSTPTNYSSPAAAHAPVHGGYPAPAPADNTDQDNA